MKFIGKICNKHPEFGGERYRYASGKTFCVECTLSRIRVWRAENRGKEAHQIMGDRSKAKYLRYMKYYSRCRRVIMTARVQDPEFVKLFEPVIVIAQRDMPDIDVRASYLKDRYDIMFAKFNDKPRIKRMKRIKEYFRLKMWTQPEFKREHTRNLLEVTERASLMSVQDSRNVLAEYWRNLYDRLAKESGEVVQSPLSSTQE